MGFVTKSYVYIAPVLVLLAIIVRHFWLDRAPGSTIDLLKEAGVQFGVVVQQTDTAINFPAGDVASPTHQCIDPFLTSEQQFVVEAIESEVRHKSFNPVVINSDRGRGKSAAIGIAAARLLESGVKTIAVTAPRFLAAEVIFKHIELLLPQADVSHGKIKYKKSTVQFYSPDQLIAEDIKAEMLFVDLGQCHHIVQNTWGQDGRYGSVDLLQHSIYFQRILNVEMNGIIYFKKALWF